MAADFATDDPVLAVIASTGSARSGQRANGGAKVLTFR